MSQASKELESKLLSTPVLIFVVGKVFGAYTLNDVIFNEVKSNTFLLIHHALTVGINIVVMIWLTACSKDIIKSFKEIDKTRKNINLLPKKLIPKESSVFAPAVIVFLLMVYVMIFGIVRVFYKVASGYLLQGYVYFVFLNLFPFK